MAIPDPVVPVPPAYFGHRLLIRDALAPGHPGCPDPGRGRDPDADRRQTLSFGHQTRKPALEDEVAAPLCPSDHGRIELAVDVRVLLDVATEGDHVHTVLFRHLPEDPADVDRG